VGNSPIQDSPNRLGGRRGERKRRRGKRKGGGGEKRKGRRGRTMTTIHNNNGSDKYKSYYKSGPAGAKFLILVKIKLDYNGLMGNVVLYQSNKKLHPPSNVLSESVVVF
jgi:hypothetical protein